MRRVRVRLRVRMKGRMVHGYDSGGLSLVYDSDGLISNLILGIYLFMILEA